MKFTPGWSVGTKTFLASRGTSWTDMAMWTMSMCSSMQGSQLNSNFGVVRGGPSGSGGRCEAAEEKPPP